MREFLETLALGAVVADVGCGNGKYFRVRHDVAVLGSDRSPGLTASAARLVRPGACLNQAPSRLRTIHTEAGFCYSPSRLRNINIENGVG